MGKLHAARTTAARDSDAAVSPSPDRVDGAARNELAGAGGLAVQRKQLAPGSQGYLQQADALRPAAVQLKGQAAPPKGTKDTKDTTRVRGKQPTSIKALQEQVARGVWVPTPSFKWLEGELASLLQRARQMKKGYKDHNPLGKGNQPLNHVVQHVVPLWLPGAVQAQALVRGLVAGANLGLKADATACKAFYALVAKELTPSWQLEHVLTSLQAGKAKQIAQSADLGRGLGNADSTKNQGDWVRKGVDGQKDVGATVIGVVFGKRGVVSLAPTAEVFDKSGATCSYWAGLDNAKRASERPDG